MFIRLTVGGDGFAFLDNGSSSSDSFSPLLSSLIGLAEAAARFDRGVVVLLLLSFFVDDFRFGVSYTIDSIITI